MIGDIFHICNRGFEKNDIFFDDFYYNRFLESAYRFNNKSNAINYKGKDIFKDLPNQDKIVAILKWCLLPNHYHFLVTELVDGGAVEFAKRLGNGYTKYVNKRKERSGYLFQNSAKIIQITSDRHFIYIPIYIDINPLNIKIPNWKKDNLSEEESLKAIDWLKKYKWSSYGSYYGESKFKPLINREVFYNLFDTSLEDYHKEIKNHLKENIF